ncbi:MAG: methylmalonyl Co-A mutase-associated GTPase MeaB [Planctomycetota bacterium]
MKLIRELLAGKVPALARAITLVENEDPRAVAILEAVHEEIGRAYRIGVTGPPGAGKSTLTGELAGHFSDTKETVGIVAVDPSSPFTVGALLGDRIRMHEAAARPGVYIRSMASRGQVGGLARTTEDVADVMDAAGKDPVIMETVGAGQAEVEIARAADTTLVVISPESGDSIQALKSGIMEIADVYVINKADRDGAKRMALELESMLDYRAMADDRRPGVVLTVARDGEGIEELADAIGEHRAWLEQSGRLRERRRERLKRRITAIVTATVEERMLARGEDVERMVNAVIAGDLTPRRAADKVLTELCPNE